MKAKGAAGSSFVVSLQIRDAHRRAEEISQGLGLKPDVAWDVGAQRLRPDGTPMSGKHAETYWGKTLESGAHAVPSALIEECLLTLGARGGFIRKLAERGARISFYVSWSVAVFPGDEFSPELLQAVAGLGAGIAVEVFP